MTEKCCRTVIQCGYFTQSCNCYVNLLVYLKFGVGGVHYHEEFGNHFFCTKFQLLEVGRCGYSEEETWQEIEIR